MKTKVIEITVTGKTGCGKSEVLEVIQNALADFYKYPANVRRFVGEDPSGAIEEAAVTGQTAKKAGTVFALYEINEA